MFCVYSMSIQPISKLYLFSLTRSSSKLKTEMHLHHRSTFSQISSSHFLKLSSSLNAALHCLCKGKCTLLFGHEFFFSLMFSLTVTHIYCIYKYRLCVTDVQIFDHHHRFPVPLQLTAHYPCDDSQ